MEGMIPESTLEVLREQLLGKRVQVTGQFHGKIPMGPVAGRCEYFGYNKFFPKWGLQITVDRMPLTNISLSQISIISE